jgi:hypothetical protein
MARYKWGFWKINKNTEWVSYNIPISHPCPNIAATMLLISIPKVIFFLHFPELKDSWMECCSLFIIVYVRRILLLLRKEAYLSLERKVGLKLIFHALTNPTNHCLHSDFSYFYFSCTWLEWLDITNVYAWDVNRNITKTNFTWDFNTFSLSSACKLRIPS